MSDKPTRPRPSGDDPITVTIPRRVMAHLRLGILAQLHPSCAYALYFTEQMRQQMHDSAVAMTEALLRKPKG